MKVGGVPFRSLWSEGDTARAIDQTRLPHEFQVVAFSSLDDVVRAIGTMQVRGAPLIGAAAAYGMALAARHDASAAGLQDAAARLLATRPTAVNLRWAVERARAHLGSLDPEARAAAAWRLAGAICDEDVARNRALGDHALGLLRGLGKDRVNVLTHCNAGWLATVDWGTATAGIYRAWDEGMDIHVWVDETRPRGQGGRLTAWELGSHGVPHTVIPDTAAAHVMARGDVDIVLVGTDRTTAGGDVANKIGTYPLALAARDNEVPFWVAAPSPSIDWTLERGTDIPIEERPHEEVSWVEGRVGTGGNARVLVLPADSPVRNFAFDVTPARLVSGIVTERGVATAEEGLAAGLRRLFPGGG